MIVFHVKENEEDAIKKAHKRYRRRMLNTILLVAGKKAF